LCVEKKVRKCQKQLSGVNPRKDWRQAATAIANRLQLA